MIINYLPAGGGIDFPPIPDKTYFTFGTYNDKPIITSVDFSNFTGEEITMPSVNDEGNEILYINSKALQTAKLGNVKKIYFNSSKSLTIVGLDREDTTFLNSPIEEATFSMPPSFVQTNYPNVYNVRVAGYNTTFKKLTINGSSLVNEISKESFYNTQISEIPFENAMLSNYRSFANCTLLNFNTTKLTRIEQECFRNCISLTNVIADQCSALGRESFIDCNKLEEISLKGLESCTNQGIFKNCTNLKIVHLNKITAISFGNESWFSNCPNIEKIYVSSENYQIVHDYLASLPYAQYGSDLADKVTIEE